MIMCPLRNLGSEVSGLVIVFLGLRRRSTLACAGHEKSAQNLAHRAEVLRW